MTVRLTDRRGTPPPQPVQRRVLVVPRPLADQLYSKLSRAYAGREDVDVVVDRRREERRHGHVGPPAGRGERRRTDRRRSPVLWSLADLPMRMAGDQLAAGAGRP